MTTTRKKLVGQSTQAEIEYKRIMAHRMSSPERPNGRDYGTNWKPDGTVTKTKRETMLGEGIGNNMGFDDPKYTPSYSPGELEAAELADQQYFDELSFKQSLLRTRNAAIKRKFRASLPGKIQEGRILVQQRVFMAYPKSDWYERAEKLGGLPQGVDVAKSDFGHLIIVPVVEAKNSRYKDPYGLKFQIEPNTRDLVQKIFGAVKWTRPLTLDEVKQFGIEVE